jgi:broad specificity phosphatase PhoE
MNSSALSIHPNKVTEIFLILHEHANRPPGLEYEYMTGRLRQQLEEGVFGRDLSPEGERRARKMGRCLKGLDIDFIVTEDFSTPRATAQLIAKAGRTDKPIPVNLDERICESDLSYLTRDRFEQLGNAEADGDPNATIRDWMEQCPGDFSALVSKHIEAWNNVVNANTGKRFAFVLHVEGFLLYPTLLFGLPPEKMACIHIPRAHPLHVRLYPAHLPLVSFGDEDYWRSKPLTIFGQYS